jgi:hypothetical protein
VRNEEIDRRRRRERKKERGYKRNYSTSLLLNSHFIQSKPED